MTALVSARVACFVAHDRENLLVLFVREASCAREDREHALRDALTHVRGRTPSRIEPGEIRRKRRMHDAFDALDVLAGPTLYDRYAFAVLVLIRSSWSPQSLPRRRDERIFIALSRAAKASSSGSHPQRYDVSAPSSRTTR